MKNNRRDFIKKSTVITAGVAGISMFGNNLFSAPVSPNDNSPFTLPHLPYDYASLEPHIDALTMQIHHDKHHAAYVTNLNKAVIENRMENISLEDLFNKASSLPPSIRNNAGGHYNHSMFWSMMRPGGDINPTGDIADAINGSFGSFEEFKEKFNDASMRRFGSGWAWLVKQNGKLVIGSTPNQDNPLMDDSQLKGTPVMCLDVWEHAYYIHYHNMRADYVTAWWNLVNWDEISKRLKEAK